MLELADAPFYVFLHLLHIGVVLVLLRYLDLYEREPFGVIAVMFAWGGLGATFLSLQGNAMVAALLPANVNLVFGAALAAPLVEEFAKGIALVVAFLVGRRLARHFGKVGFQGVADGVVYGAAVGLGFAFTENFFFFLNFAIIDGSLLSGLELFLLRVDLTGLQGLLHAYFSALFGAGLGLAAWSRTWIGKVGFPLAGLLAAMLAHALWNGLPQLLLVLRFGFDTVAEAFAGVALESELEEAVAAAFTASRRAYYVGLAIVAVGFGLWLRYERQIIRFELAEELDRGLLSKEEWAVLPQFWRRSHWYATLLRAGQLDQMVALSRLHDALVKLALVKWNVRRTGSDAGQLDRLRREIDARRRYVSELLSATHPQAPAPGSSS